MPKLSRYIISVGHEHHVVPGFESKDGHVEVMAHESAEAPSLSAALGHLTHFVIGDTRADDDMYSPETRALLEEQLMTMKLKWSSSSLPVGDQIKLTADTTGGVETIEYRIRRVEPASTVRSVDDASVGGHGGTGLAGPSR